MNNEEILNNALAIACEKDKNFMPLKIGEYSYPEAIDQIFSHDFAKAFFGDKPICIHCGENGGQCVVCIDYAHDHNSAWEYHLQQMVIREDPIKYLEYFIT